MKLYQEILVWFLENRRSFPWRPATSGYATLVAETMLQQTQTTTVLSFFTRWMARFPTLDSLSEASLEEVLLYWEGLGYYKRAQSLWLAAKQLSQERANNVPDTFEALKKLPGVGDYTANAILALFYQKPVIAIDANVIRVVARYFGIRDAVDKQIGKQKIREAARQFLFPSMGPSLEHASVAEGLIELGALVCKKKPLCHRCPLQAGCIAYKEQSIQTIPRLPEKREPVFLTKIVPIVLCEDCVWVMFHPQERRGIFLYTFPELEVGSEIDEGLWLTQQGFVGAQKIQAFDPIVHSFTHHRCTLLPALWRVPKRPLDSSLLWIALHDRDKYPFFGGHRAIANNLLAWVAAASVIG